MVASLPSAQALSRRNRIVTQARKLFMEHGFHATGVAQISERSGVAVQQLYRDFENKEAIVAEIVKLDINKLFEAIFLPDGHGEGDSEDFNAWFGSIFEACFHELDPRLLLEMQAEASRNPRIAKILREHDVYIRDALFNALSRFASPQTPQSMIMTAVDLTLMAIFGLASRHSIDPGLDKRPLLHEITSCLNGAIRR